jgi:hypothetical protein
MLNKNKLEEAKEKNKSRDKNYLKQISVLCFFVQSVYIL